MQTAYQTTDKMGKYDSKTKNEKDSKDTYRAKQGIDSLVKDTPKSGLEKKTDIYSPLLGSEVTLGDDEQKLYKALLAFAVLHSYISQEITRMYGGLSDLPMGYDTVSKKNTSLGNGYGKQGEESKGYQASKMYNGKTNKGYTPQVSSAKVEYKN